MFCSEEELCPIRILFQNVKLDVFILFTENGCVPRCKNVQTHQVHETSFENFNILETFEHLVNCWLHILLVSHTF